ncbi:MAG TPA: MFS transporter [Candidatus Deferrimicrobium sp.]|nr:MFS transporter [Candidatus Deferrimicrobium sp.]
MLKTNGTKFFTRFMILQVIMMGVLFTAAQVFGLIEAEMFNTYLDHVLHLEAIFITIMVVFSALVGLITNIIFGIMSDNTRSRFGRRRPFILFGGFLTGISMIVYAYSGSFLMALIIDAIAIGAASNSYYMAQRALIPDLIDINHRGRVNGIINNFGTIGYGVGIALFLLLNEFYGIPDPEGGTMITQAGYIFALTIGGILFILVAIIGFIGIREPNASELPPKRPFTQEFKEIFNIRELRKNREFYKFVIAFTIFQAGNSVFLPFMFIYIFDLGFSTTTLLLIIGIAAPILFLVTYLLGHFADKTNFGRKRLLAPTILISSLGFFLVPFLAMTPEPIIPLYVLIFTLLLVMLISIMTPLSAWYQDLLPDDQRGKFLGILNITNTLSQVIGVTVGGIAASLWGISWIFAFAPIFYLCSIPLFWTIKETLPAQTP